MSNYIQGSPEWLEMKKNFIGGSDAPVIMGVSPFKTQYQLFEEKNGIRVQAETPAMRRGKEFEKVALDMFSKQIGVELEQPVLFHPQVPFINGSFDGLNREKGVAVEIKCPGRSDHDMVREGIAPAIYYPQFQHLVKVGELDGIWYVSYFEGAIEAVYVKRDEGYIEKMLEEEAAFWRRLKTFDPPDSNERDYRKMNSAAWMFKREEYLEVKERKRLIEEDEERIRQELIHMCEGESCEGGGLKVIRMFKKGNVDYGNIPELRKIDLEKYRAPSKVVWSIRLT